MRFQLTEIEGEFLVKLARKAVEKYLKIGKIIKTPQKLGDNLTRRCGVFITINSLELGKKILRGCIGYPYPTTMLAQAIIECAISSATQDPRFPPLSADELDNIVFEISVLTPPEPIKIGNPKDLPSIIKVGEDGLIVESGMQKGLLLPQVPIEWNWDEREFLSHCCIKAGLLPDSWLTKSTKIHKFRAIIFEEATPKGKIKRKVLRRH
ncbi:MAG: TIGR00296 family protein [Candidatus Bathyarchaeota archaeon]|nr:MAG: TIGR00296 family protein [Candidatus Bathyarchaeota archaeon]